MKKITLTLLIAFSILSCKDKIDKQSKSKEIKKGVNQIEKEDPLNLYNSAKINSIDFLEALDILGVQIHKVELGEFDEKKNLILLIEEFESGVLKSVDTLSLTSNEYYESINENGSPNMGFINQIKFFTKTENERSELLVKTYQGQITKRFLKLRKTDDNQFFLWRNYKETYWKADKKVPLLIFASSWFDERINNHIFCGIAKLTENTESTDELLNNSPNYLMVSYKVTK